MMMMMMNFLFDASDTLKHHCGNCKTKTIAFNLRAPSYLNRRRRFHVCNHVGIVLLGNMCREAISLHTFHENCWRPPFVLLFFVCVLCSWFFLVFLSLFFFSFLDHFARSITVAQTASMDCFHPTWTHPSLLREQPLGVVRRPASSM